MPSPFPGMNPYLENPAFWSEFHNLLISSISQTLNPILRPKYRVVIEQRVYQTSEPIFDLQNILHDLYDRVSYDLVIDYTKEPVPALSNTDKDWLNTFLQENGFR